MPRLPRPPRSETPSQSLAFVISGGNLLSRLPQNCGPGPVLVAGKAFKALDQLLTFLGNTGIYTGRLPTRLVGRWRVFWGF